MAWTNISNALVAVGAKPFATTMQALRDNIVSLAAGDPGAPRVVLGAIERLEAGDQIRSRQDDTLTDSPGGVTSANAVRSFDFMQAGTIRLYFEHSGSGASIRRVRAGVSTTLASFGAGTFVARTGDFPVQPGDSLVVVANGTGTAQIRNFRLSTNGQNLWPGSRVPLEGNVFP